DEQLNEQLRFHSNATGAVPGPWDCWLSLRGLKTLAVRMRQHEANARAIAEYLSRHPTVEETVYPGLPSHPQHELARQQMDGFGAIVAFRLRGGNSEVGRFVKALKVFLFAESLGGVESLVCHPATMSHGALSPEERLQMGITEGTLRLSVGIEDVQDLTEDLAGALAACSG
ncbi:MAG: cystathionine gamma-synthase, partial [Planctomycetes bacterium]|nr:cystathionine gamma-synthase [Planctomycetota bacterium]